MKVKFENVQDAIEMLTEVNEFIRNLDSNEDEFNAKHDEIFSLIACAKLNLEKLDKYDTNKNTNEVIYLKTNYVFKNCRSEFYICFDTVYSVNDLEVKHIYEVETMRMMCVDDRVFHSRIIILSDFDLEHCQIEETKETFLEEVHCALLDVRFDNINYSIKQLS